MVHRSSGIIYLASATQFRGCVSAKSARTNAVSGQGMHVRLPLWTTRVLCSCKLSCR